MRVPWMTRRSDQSILKEINPEYSLEGLMLKLRLQYFGHLMQKANSLEKTPMLGEIEGMEKRMAEDEMVGWHHQLNGCEFEQTLRNSEGREAWRATVHRVAKSQTGLKQLSRSMKHLDHHCPLRI